MIAPLKIEGKRFGLLLVLHQAEHNSKRGNTVWVCKCDCGNIKQVVGPSLASGNTKSCGCVAITYRKHFGNAITHGHSSRISKSQEYRSWQSMKARCCDKDHRAYRGITLCDEWRHDFAAFYADMGACPDDFQIDRIDNEKGYSPDNCRWVSTIEQGRNRRDVKLSMDKARAIRADPRRYRIIAKEYGVSLRAIEEVRANRTWKET